MQGQDLKLLNLICDKAFIEIIKALQIEVVVGIGKFAEKHAISAIKNQGEINVKVSAVLIIKWRYCISFQIFNLKSISGIVNTTS